MPKNFFWKKNAPTSLASQNAVMISLFYMMYLGREEKVYILAWLLRGKVKELSINYYAFPMGVY